MYVHSPRERVVDAVIEVIAVPDIRAHVYGGVAVIPPTARWSSRVTEGHPGRSGEGDRLRI
jgi:hypothetical protein